MVRTLLFTITEKLPIGSFSVIVNSRVLCFFCARATVLVKSSLKRLLSQVTIPYIAGVSERLTNSYKSFGISTAFNSSSLSTPSGVSLFMLRTNP